MSADPGIQALLGYPPGDFLDGRIALLSRLHPDDLDVAEARFAATCIHPGGFNIRMRQADGRIRCLRGESTALAGGLIELVLQDAKSLRQETGAMTADFTAMMENTDDFIYFKDRNHVFTGASQTLVAITRPAEHWRDLIGQTDYDVFPEAYADHYYRLEKQVFAGLPVAREIQEYRANDGRIGWVDNRKYPIRDADGTIIGLFGIARDITDKLAAEQALRRQRETLQLILDYAPIGIWLQDAKGKLAFVNQPFCQAMGISEAAFLAVPHYGELIPEAFRRQCLDSDAKALAGTGISETHQRLPFVDGRIHDLRVIKAVKRDEQGRPDALVGLSLDITDELERQRALRESEARFRTIFEQVPAISVQGYDRDRRVIFWNPASEKLYGYTEAQALGRQLEDLIIPEPMRAEVIRLTTAWAAGGPAIPAGKLTLRHADGRPVEVYSSHVMLHNAEGEPEMYCIDIDLSDLSRAEAALRVSEERLRLALAASNQAWFDVELPSGRVTISPEYPRMIGHDPEHFESSLENWLAHVHPDDRDAVMAAFDACIRMGGPNAIEYRRRTAAGEWKWIRSIGKIVAWSPDGRAARMVGIHADITRLKEHEQQLEHIAHYDALTGLPNRILLSDRLHLAMAQAARRGQKLAVAYIDLDGFKAINDRHGHAAGDQLLLAVATAMKQSLREGDTLARLGGDEFVAVLIDLQDIEASVPLLGRLLAAAARPAQVDELRLQISASLGVTFYPQAEEVDADQLLRQADQAMYQSKLAGKNRYHIFDAEEDRSVRSHHESIERIRLALQRQEFVLYFQPKVNMRTGALVGAEALIRWRHPDRGLLPPALFLPVIENHALAVALGEWVIDSALSQIASWRADGLDIPVSVNIAAHHLLQADFVERLRGLLAAHPDLDPTRLELEVLETSALEDLALAAQVLDACRAIGVRFALDDFGTGYSSLTYLKRLAVAQIKIDRSFVRDLLDNPDDQAILEGVLGLARVFRR
ncbi:MAG: EAL domain-containing protein, partial [Thiobacillus sp.]|nr:EAL domain-containing protein [Thiobacillus sp.]